MDDDNGCCGVHGGFYDLDTAKHFALTQAAEHLCIDTIVADNPPEGVTILNPDQGGGWTVDLETVWWEIWPLEIPA